jgi:hypothetical protein
MEHEMVKIKILENFITRINQQENLCVIHDGMQ